MRQSAFLIWAHRGASATAPENTLAAFRAAEQAGADGIECDVHLSRDGVPVVIHDETLDRTTSGNGNVTDKTAADLRRLDAGSWFAQTFSKESIPTLSEVLDWAGSRLRLNIEIKTVAAGQKVIELLGRYPEARVLISSFHLPLLDELRQLDHRVPLAFLADQRRWRPVLDRAAAAGAEAFHPRWDLVTPELVAACRSFDLAVNTWTVDDPATAARLREMGVTGIFTNDPETLRAALGETGAVDSR